MSESEPAGRISTDEPAQSPVEPVPPSAALAARSSRRPWIVAAGLAMGLLATVGIVQLARSPGPEEVVEEFFAAILERDVERALAHVGGTGQGVPYGEAAVFLHPDAIADGWELVEVGPAEEATGGGTRVRVEIGDGPERAVGHLEVSDRGDEWTLVDPFVSVALAGGPLTYLQVNDRTVTREELYGHHLGAVFFTEYRLLPGRYEFFGAVAGADAGPAPARLLVPSADRPDPSPVTPPELSPSAETVAAVQQEVDSLLDDCVEFAVPHPPGCPFGIDSSFEYGDGHMIDGIRDVEWAVVEYPIVQLADPGGEEREDGLTVSLEEPGLIQVTVEGRRVGPDIDGVEVGDVPFECRVSGEDLSVALRPDGTPEVYLARGRPLAFGGFMSSPPVNTCEYVPEGAR